MNVYRVAMRVKGDEKILEKAHGDSLTWWELEEHFMIDVSWLDGRQPAMDAKAMDWPDCPTLSPVSQDVLSALEALLMEGLHLRDGLTYRPLYSQLACRQLKTKTKGRKENINTKRRIHLCFLAPLLPPSVSTRSFDRYQDPYIADWDGHIANSSSKCGSRALFSKSTRRRE